jgi:transmembrane sensor
VVISNVEDQTSEYEQAELEAAIWLIRLSEAPDDHVTKMEFTHWLTQRDINKTLFEQTQASSNVLESIQPTTSESWPVAHTDTLTPAQDPQGHSWLSIFSRWSPLGKKSVLAATFACCLLLIFFPQLILHLEADYTTSTAEQKTITLSDGSQITLAPKSALTVDFSPHQRRLNLLKGKAFFDVTPNPDRPFIVMSGQTQTTVLGTAFNIKRTNIGTRVSVEEGYVQVKDYSTAHTISEQLQAGDQLQVTWHQSSVRSQLNPADIALWRTGKLVARNLSIGELIDILRSYYKGSIIVQAPNFEALHVSGLYELNQPEKTLNNLADSYNAKVTKISPWLLIISEAN